MCSHGGEKDFLLNFLRLKISISRKFFYLFSFCFFSVHLLHNSWKFIFSIHYMCNVCILRRKMQTQQYSNKPGTFAILYSFAAVLMQINYFFSFLLLGFCYCHFNLVSLRNIVLKYCKTSYKTDSNCSLWFLHGMTEKDLFDFNRTERSMNIKRFNFLSKYYFSKKLKINLTDFRHFSSRFNFSILKTSHVHFKKKNREYNDVPVICSFLSRELRCTLKELRSSKWGRKRKTL